MNLEIDDHGIMIGCDGTAVISNNNKEAVAGSRANTRLEGTVLVLATFGIAGLVPASGTLVAKRLIKRLPDCKDL